MNTEPHTRKDMIEGIIKEVQGPRYGVNEVISYDPFMEYIVGIVIPQSWHDDLDGSALSPDNEDVIEIIDEFSEDSFIDNEIIKNISSKELHPKSLIKSFGISFTVDTPNPTLDICATWGRYFEDSNSNKAFDLSDNLVEITSDNTVWKRYSFGEIFKVKVDSEYVDDESIKKPINNDKELVIVKTLDNTESEKEIDDDEGFVKIYIKRLNMGDGIYTISVYMLNNLNYIQKENDFHADTDLSLFQPEIRINCDCDIKTRHVDTINESEQEIDFLYRNKPTIASGHMCSAIWKDIDYADKIDLNQLWPDYASRLECNKEYGKFLCPDLRTEFVPLFPVSLPNFDLKKNSKLTKNDLMAKSLANKSPEEVYELLLKLPELYEEWIESNLKESLSFERESYKVISEKLINKEKLALRRMKQGINLIKTNDLVYTAFCFANKVMDLQKQWGSPEEFKWRPFQIAFFLMNLEDIWEENSKNRDILDLLWIPTGGGKTEAYLGIMAYTMALRRLKAYEKNEPGAGTAIISRYTLRLLTVQQFRRTLKMVTAAEYLRIYNEEGNVGWRPKYSEIEGDWIYGSTRFSTGLWVGGGVSPLHLIKKGGAMDILKGEDIFTPFSQGEPAQILKCPVCGSWLSVPNTGLNDEVNKLHLVIKDDLDMDEIKNSMINLFKGNSTVNFIDIYSKNHNKSFYTLSFEIYGEFSRKQFEDEIINPILDEGFHLASLGMYNIGYFTSLNSIEKNSRKINGDFDFEIWCTNPDCSLNNVEWYEGEPFPNSSKFKFPDGNYNRFIYSPFEQHTRMPIPAYLIDDHVYTRCPTVIISTADKIARLAFEPKAGAIFGNVNNYNKYFGYNRDSMFPANAGNMERFNVPVKPFKSLDLIIQDELHLIEGPLGSLFGLYEAMVSAIIENQGGSPKYIASTATISNAKKQVELLFSKDLFQFPPYGLDMVDNFFVRDYSLDESWDEKKPGRIYLGIYAAGRGPMTPQVRLWGRMLKISQECIENEDIKNFWTIVGYYNSIKELGGALALYRDDIRNRFDIVGGLEEYRLLTDDTKEELSSRVSSIDLPIILDNLERDGINKPKIDAIFTTSMFGTGVDISHLSLMIMNSQPKTTGAYIQATGRIGRNHGGLIVDFFKSGRSRDLNHYEMFGSYHSKIYLGVEPVSVSPYSQGCISRGLGPAMVAFLRNSTNLKVNWKENDGKKPILNANSFSDFFSIIGFLEDRITSSEYVDNEVIDTILSFHQKCIDEWKNIANSVEDKRKLTMYEYSDKPVQNVVLGSPIHKHKNLKVVYENAPQSLRDVEETIDFWV